LISCPASPRACPLRLDRELWRALTGKRSAARVVAVAVGQDLARDEQWNEKCR
jgi:hypothetical protein